MNKQALELNNIKLELANAFIELDKKKNQLVVSQKENESSQSRLENEIKNLTSNYKKLQRRRIVTSIIFRKFILFVSEYYKIKSVCTIKQALLSEDIS